MNESRKNHTEVFFQDKRDGDIMDERMANFFGFLSKCFFCAVFGNGIVYLRDLKKKREW